MLGKPKHGGKDEENLTHFFRHYQFFIILVVILNLAIVIVCFVIDANLTGRHLGHNKEVLLLVPFCLKCLHRVDAYEMRAGILRRRNGIFMKAVLSLCLF